MEPLLIEIVDKGLTVSDWIQIISAIATFIISVISIVIAVVAVRQTKKAAEKAANDLQESVRGNVGISYDMIQHSNKNPIGYFLIKNYGASPLRFEQFIYDEELLNNNQNENRDAFRTQFDRIKDLTLAPSQAIRIHFIEKNISSHEYHFSFKYQTNGKHYQGEIRINVAAITGILRGKKLAHDPEESVAVLLAEIAERMM